MEAMEIKGTGCFCEAKMPVPFIGLYKGSKFTTELTMHYADRLQAAIEAKGAPVVVGIDPRPDLIPDVFFDDAFEEMGKTPEAVCAAIKAFSLKLLEIVGSHVPAVKPQVAFFEALGAPGMQVYSAICEYARELGLIVIADVKRNDIGSTAEAYAQGLFGKSKIRGVNMHSLQVDAATVTAYLGSDGILPIRDRARENSAGLYVLARTSNPGSAEFQQLELKDGGTLVDEVSRKISEWGSDNIGDGGYSDVGAVVGATHPDAAKHLRKLMPKTLFLVPGWGAQGGVKAAIKACFDDNGQGAIVNSSRGVIHAYAKGPFAELGQERWKEAVEKATIRLKEDINRIVKG